MHWRTARVLPKVGAGLALALAVVGGQAAFAATSSPLGDEAVVALQPQTSPDWWFPIESAADYTNLNGQISDLMYLPLINVTGKDVLTSQGAATDKVTWNPNGTVYHIYLKKNLNWSNGKPVTGFP